MLTLWPYVCLRLSLLFGRMHASITNDTEPLFRWKFMTLIVTVGAHTPHTKNFCANPTKWDLYVASVSIRQSTLRAQTFNSRLGYHIAFPILSYTLIKNYIVSIEHKMIPLFLITIEFHLSIVHKNWFSVFSSYISICCTNLGHYRYRILLLL